jgi:uncharacterized protein YebE (UPF0316 family)
MTQEELPDMALQALLRVTKEIDIDLPEDLIRKAYAIQRRHQFDREDEREVSLQEMQRLVEEYIGQNRTIS